MASTSVLVNREEAGVPAGTYSYCSRPRAVTNRQRYRTALETNELDEEPVHYANLMYERRVVRGNTYALHVLPWSSEPDPLELQRQREAHRKMLARKRAKEQLRTGTPEPLEGRRHVDVQTELYLEELADRIIEVDVECQTDAFLDRPATPLFIPTKTGRDVATQIWEGELFDFDIEVRPMLEVLVGKTIEQALLEVAEEEELANLQAHQYAFHEMRAAELAEVQRLEEQERRHREEKERRKKQQTEITKKEKETAEKIAARAFAQRYLSDLLPSVFGSLRDSGYFYDPVERDIEMGFMPWIMVKMETLLEKKILSRVIADSLIRDVMEMRLEAFELGVLPQPFQVFQPPDQESEPTDTDSSMLTEPLGPLGSPERSERAGQPEEGLGQAEKGQAGGRGDGETAEPPEVPGQSEDPAAAPDQGQEEQPEDVGSEPQGFRTRTRKSCHPSHLPDQLLRAALPLSGASFGPPRDAQEERRLLLRPSAAAGAGQGEEPGCPPPPLSRPATFLQEEQTYIKYCQRKALPFPAELGGRSRPPPQLQEAAGPPLHGSPRQDIPPDFEIGPPKAEPPAALAPEKKPTSPSLGHPSTYRKAIFMSPLWPPLSG
ncbi:radial spoke head protein 3 homolog B-like [Candoia aspera]|uniref:radial spoke head protein 3 homolog B-like n=1 Tax=Candoia aspera TaxID=51853 RepID=UPI002FD7B08B